MRMKRKIEILGVMGALLLLLLIKYAFRLIQLRCLLLLYPLLGAVLAVIAGVFVLWFLWR